MLLLTAYVSLLHRNWLEKQFQNGRLLRAHKHERLALPTVSRPASKLIWVHVDGEEGALGLSEFLWRLSEKGLGAILLTSQEDLPDHFISKRIPPSIIYQRVPLGVQSITKRFLDHWSPDLLIWASTALSVRLLHDARRKGVPSIWVDIRLSYARRRKWFLMVNYYRSLIRSFDLILCQDRVTRRLLRSFGVGRQRIHVLGSFVGGGAVPDDSKARRLRWTEVLRDRQIWLAAQVTPGELNTVYDAFDRARRQSHRLLLVLQSSSERPDGLRGDQFFIAHKPSPNDYQREMDVLIVPKKDLGMWYRLAPVCYLGGNLSEGESHNPFAPAALGSAVITGPRWTRYRDLYTRLELRDAIEVVAGAQGLARTVAQTISPDRAAELAHRAWDVSTEGAQVADKAVAYVSEILIPEQRDEAA
ncbi:MAG: glycosyltransferase N-terminal domain-containing protein [Pseudomonadota bacterium]